MSTHLLAVLELVGLGMSSFIIGFALGALQKGFRRTIFMAADVYAG